MLGIIGGTGLYELAGDWETVVASTPYGEIEAYAGELGGAETIFLPRHGRGHTVPPHLVNYRGNITALQVLGCRQVLAFNAVGSLLPGLEPGAFCLAEQFLDFTCTRARSLFEPPEVRHVDVTEPYCVELRRALSEAAVELGGEPLPEVVYVCTEGPRFETAAEIRMFAQLGGGVVGMTGVPEVVFAREAELCYASLCLVCNWGAGMEPGHRLYAGEVTELVNQRLGEVQRLLEGAARRLGGESACECGPGL
ncbi:MAG TPA: S-methyl-5'-thioinosine phosphorylase [Armatimonadota bacterium]|jgi:5'-methylthioadenosine phosphorylase